MSEITTIEKTCANCKHGSKSSRYPQCIDCICTDTPENRFPNWESENARTVKLA